MDSSFEVRDLPLRAKKFEDVRLGDCDIDASQVEQIVNIRGGAAGHGWQHAHLVAVVEELAQVLGETEEGPFDDSAGDADGPGIFLHLHFSIRAALLKGLLTDATLTQPALDNCRRFSPGAEVIGARSGQGKYSAPAGKTDPCSKHRIS